MEMMLSKIGLGPGYRSTIRVRGVPAWLTCGTWGGCCADKVFDSVGCGMMYVVLAEPEAAMQRTMFKNQQCLISSL